MIPVGWKTFLSNLIPISIPKWLKIGVIPESIPIPESESPIFVLHFPVMFNILLPISKIVTKSEIVYEIPLCMRTFLPLTNGVLVEELQRRMLELMCNIL